LPVIGDIDCIYSSFFVLFAGRYNLLTLGVKTGNICLHCTVKPVLFACPLFHEYRDLGDFATVTAREYVST